MLGARYAATALVTPGPGPGTSPGPGDGGPDNQTGSAGLLDGMISLTGSAMVLAILVSTIIAVAAVSVARRQSVEQLEADVIIPWLLPAPPVEVRIDLEVE